TDADGEPDLELLYDREHRAPATVNSRKLSVAQGDVKHTRGAKRGRNAPLASVWARDHPRRASTVGGPRRRHRPGAVLTAELSAMRGRSPAATALAIRR